MRVCVCVHVCECVCDWACFLLSLPTRMRSGRSGCGVALVSQCRVNRSSHRRATYSFWGWGGGGGLVSDWEGGGWGGSVCAHAHVWRVLL